MGQMTTMAASDAARRLFRQAMDHTASSPPEGATVADIGEAIRRYQDTAQPVQSAGRSLAAHSGPIDAQSQIEDALRPFGAKIAPGMHDDPARAWRVAVRMALSDLPLHAIVQGAKVAFHRPMQFLNEVETSVRAEAEAILLRERNALGRLRRWQREISGGGDGRLRPVSSPRCDDAGPLTVDQLLAVPAELRRLGASLGFIDQDLLDAVEQAANPTGSKDGENH